MENWKITIDLKKVLWILVVILQPFAWAIGAGSLLGKGLLENPPFGLTYEELVVFGTRVSWFFFGILLAILIGRQKFFEKTNGGGH